MQGLEKREKTKCRRNSFWIGLSRIRNQSRSSREVVSALMSRSLYVQSSKVPVYSAALFIFCTNEKDSTDHDCFVAGDPDESGRAVSRDVAA